jgi:hypothetical protein
VHSEAHPGVGMSISKDSSTEINATSPFNSGSYPNLSPNTAALTSALSYSSVNPGSAASVNNNANCSSYLDGSNNFSMSSGTLTLPAGTYYFNTMTLGSSATINCTGAVTIYVNGNVTITGKLNAYNSIPANVQLQVIPSATVSYTTNVATYMVLYAPASAVTVTNNKGYFGSVVGNTLFLSTHTFHYDEALSGATGGGGGTSGGKISVKIPKH